MLKQKKGVSEILATILIVLFVIAALVIVSVVLFQFIRSKSDEIKIKADCASIILSIPKAKYFSATNITMLWVKKDKGDVDINNLKFIIDGKEKTPVAGDSTKLKTLEEGSYNFSVSAKPAKIEVAPVIFITESEKEAVCENVIEVQGKDIV
ncbi:hypothetical protein HYT26_03580 [Candidatus Pacearchaeota archaeon]|nr:hypothetical protein [Candidatus Pacearchaeota archaeon]